MAIFKIIVIIGFIVTKTHLQDWSPSTFFSFPKDNTPNWKYRIIGGDVVSPPNLYPFQVALNIRYAESVSLCGGSLISQEWVVTAAHCVENNPLYIDLILGAHNLEDTNEITRQKFRTTLYFLHSDWDSNTLQNDIALIKLPRNVTLNENIGLIEVATGNNTYETQNGTILGWGRTETGQTSNPLLQVVVEIMTNAECIAANPAYNVIQNSHLCTSGLGSKGSCNGDSGGPLITDNFLVGLVSFGPEDCTLGFPSVFTRLTSFSEWIVSTMELQANATMISDDSAKISINIVQLVFLLIPLYLI